MALVLKRLYQGYLYLTHERVDPKNEDAFMASPLFLLSFLTAYILIVKKIGPQLMQNKKPYNIRKIIIIYNIIQILANTYIFAKGVYAYERSPTWICLNSSARDVINFARYEIICLKMLDCVETVFFILKKNFRQVSFLHVYHHSGMVAATWITLRYEFGDSIIFVGLLNSAVHVVMFTYYLLTSIDPEWKNNLTIKKALTQIQLVQFVIFILFYGTEIAIPNCKGAPPTFGAIMWIIQNLFMLMLFGDFYFKTYWKKKEKKI